MREIAAELVLGETTVKTHLAHIYAKLGVRGRIELLATLQSPPRADSPATEESAPARGSDSVGRGILGVSRRLMLPGLIAVAAVGLAIVGSLALQPADKPADLERLLANDGVQSLELRGSTLLITTQWSSQTQIANVDPATVRQLAIDYSVPLSVTSAAGAESGAGPIALLVGLSALAVAIALFIRRLPSRRRPAST